MTDRAELPAVEAFAPRAARLVTILLVARLVTPRGDWPCRVRNVSSGGMMLESGGALQPDEHVRLELRNAHAVAGRIAWTRGERAGVQFDAQVEVPRLLEQPARGPNLPQPRGLRFDTLCPLRIRGEGAGATAMLLDLSQRGARIDTALPLKRDEMVTVVIPGFDPRQGAVRWTREGAAGVAFPDLLPYDAFSDWLRTPNLRFAGR